MILANGRVTSESGDYNIDRNEDSNRALFYFAHCVKQIQEGLIIKIFLSKQNILIEEKNLMLYY